MVEVVAGFAVYLVKLLKIKPLQECVISLQANLTIELRMTASAFLSACEAPSTPLTQLILTINTFFQGNPLSRYSRTSCVL